MVEESEWYALLKDGYEPSLITSHNTLNETLKNLSGFDVIAGRCTTDPIPCFINVCAGTSIQGITTLSSSQLHVSITFNTRNTLNTEFTFPAKVT